MNMRVSDAKAYLEKHGASYGVHYTVGGLGDGVTGIEKIGSYWYSYVSEMPYKYRKTNYVRLADEAEACKVIIKEGKAKALSTNDWID